MSVVQTLTTPASPGQVLAALDSRLGRTEKVHEELLEAAGSAVGLAVYEQYFLRVDNRVALMIVADDFSGTAAVRIIATGASSNLLLSFDWGATGAYAAEAAGIISSLGAGGARDHSG
ncbi:MAG TPA: hypothetical protein DCM14_08765 [Clostridiales bacterium UBA8153]|nr:hypothetical protein [Clostridiales bacterium UBA8153]